METRAVSYRAPQDRNSKKSEWFGVYLMNWSKMCLQTGVPSLEVVVSQ